ncbi:MAG TPA: TIGR03619 family F420-dependent LLM class oxidoreductase [Microlunatus sp.]
MSTESKIAAGSKINIGVVLPDEDASMPASTLVELAQQAEELGYDRVYLPDHILPPGDFGATFGGVYEPIVTLSHLAAVTSRIELGTSVLVLPLRNPFVLAKQVATVQQLSAGRVVLGVGTGWSAEEFAAVGADYRRRGRTTDDALALIRHLFAVGRGPYAADGFGFDQGVFAPAPTPPVPILVGGNSTRALRRAATYADNWQGLPMPADDLARRIEELGEFAGERTVSPGIRIQWDDSRPVGTVAGEIAAYRAAGAEHIAVHFDDFRDYPSRMTALAAALVVDGHISGPR